MEVLDSASLHCRSSCLKVGLCTTYFLNTVMLKSTIWHFHWEYPVKRSNHTTQLRPWKEKDKPRLLVFYHKNAAGYAPSWFFGRIATIFTTNSSLTRSRPIANSCSEGNRRKTNILNCTTTRNFLDFSDRFVRKFIWATPNIVNSSYTAHITGWELAPAKVRYFWSFERWWYDSTLTNRSTSNAKTSTKHLLNIGVFVKVFVGDQFSQWCGSTGIGSLLLFDGNCVESL